MDSPCGGLAGGVASTLPLRRGPAHAPRRPDPLPPERRRLPPGQIRSRLRAAGYPPVGSAPGDRYYRGAGLGGRPPGGRVAGRGGAGGGRRSPAMTPHPQMERSLALLEAAACGSEEAAEQLGALLPGLAPGEISAPVLSGALALAVEVGAGSRTMTDAVLGVLARAGVVPEGSDPDNRPSALFAPQKPVTILFR